MALKLSFFDLAVLGLIGFAAIGIAVDEFSKPERSPGQASCQGLVMDGAAHLTDPNWFEANLHCFNETDEKTLEEQLYAAVQQVPAHDAKRKRDGYKGLTILQPTKQLYQDRLAQYDAQLAEAFAESGASDE